MEMLEQVFGRWMSFLTKPAQIKKETVDLATSSAAVEFRFHTQDSLKSHQEKIILFLFLMSIFFYFSA